MNLKLYFILSFTFLTIHLNAQQWQLISPSPNPPVLFISAPDSIHLKGYNDHIFFRSNDGGLTWNGTRMNLFIDGIFFLDSLNGWISCDSLNILHTIDGGITWSQQILTYPNSPAAYISNLQFITPVIGFCLIGNTFYSTYNGGNSWYSWATAIHHFSNATMKFINSRIGWAACSSDTVIFKTTDGGFTWNRFSLPTPLQVSFANSNLLTFIDSLKGWIALLSDSVLKTTDGGITWQIFPAGMKNGNIIFQDSLHGFMCKVPTVYYTSDGGLTWSLCFIVQGYNFGEDLDVIMTGGNYYITAYGNLFKSTDAQNWTRLETYNFPTVSSGLTYPFLKFRSRKTGVSVSGMIYNHHVDVYYNNVFLTTDSCKSWNQVFNDNPPCSDIELVSDSTFYYTLFDGNARHWNIYKTNDAFRSRVFIGTSSSPAICFTDSMHGLFYGQYSIDGGMTWNPSIVHGGNGGFKDIFFQNQFDGWAIDSADVFKTTDGGTSWMNIYNSDSTIRFSKILFADSMIGFILPFPNRNIFLKTMDGGLTWDSINTPFSCSDLYFHDALRGWLAASPGNPSQTGIYYTSDGGATFTRQDTLNVNYLSFVDSAFGYAAGSQLLLKSDQSNILSSVGDISQPSNFTIYPNPSSDMVFICSNEEIFSMELFDNQGKLVLRNIIDGQTYNLNTQNLNEGFYVLKLFFRNKSFTQKIIHIH